MSEKQASKSQTKEEQEKKKLAFNSARVRWLIGYLEDAMPTFYQMHISPNRNVLLNEDEQFAMGKLIQAGIAGKMVLADIAEHEGTEPEHLQKTISGDKDQVLSLLADAGYSTERFIRDRSLRRKLRRTVDDAWNARDLFAEKNLGLVTMIAGRRNRSSNTGAVDFDDLVAEGMNGLMVAIDHFNPDLGNRFSTPAAWWIDQPIRNYLDAKTKTIHMPTHMNNVYKAIYYATKALRDEYADDADITDEMIAEFCQKSGRDNVTVEKIAEARKFRRETVSYDAPLGDGGNEKTLAELIESEEDVAEGVLDGIGAHEGFNKMLSLVEDDKKREILRDWYSTDETQDVVILSNVSRKHCLTKERVRQLKSEGEAELKAKISKLAETRGSDLWSAVARL